LNSWSEVDRRLFYTRNVVKISDSFLKETGKNSLNREELFFLTAIAGAADGSQAEHCLSAASQPSVVAPRLHQSSGATAAVGIGSRSLISNCENQQRKKWTLILVIGWHVLIATGGKNVQQT
jgi:hypothetical protein